MGGATSAVYNLIRYMKAEGHDVYLISNGRDGALIDKIRKLNVEYYYPAHPYSLTIWPQTYNPLKFVKRLLINVLLRNKEAKKFISEIISRIKPDIVHTNVGPLDIALDSCKEQNIPHIWHMREYQDKDFDMHFFPTKGKFIKRIHSEGNYNIAITDNIFKYWELRKGIDKVIYDGVFSEELLPTTVKVKEKYILFVGRVEPAKGLDIALKAFASFRKKYQDDEYKLIVAGEYFSEGPNKEYKEKCDHFIRENGIKNKVLFLGNRNDVYELMSKASCMIVASRFEGFGFITVEAMLNHCVVIGRLTGGTKEQLLNGLNYESSPIAYSFSTVEECSERLHEALSSDNHDMINRAYHMVINHYTNEICGKETERYYESVINKFNNRI